MLTFYVRPTPLQLGSDLVMALESKWANSGKDSLFELLSTAESWERCILRYGSEQLHHLETVLKSIKMQNIDDIKNLNSRILSLGDTISHWHQVGQEEFGHMETVIANMSSNGLMEIENILNKSIASLLNASWPVSRWPMYILRVGPCSAS